MAGESAVWGRRWTIPGTLADALPIVDEILAHLRRQGWAERDIFAVHLALTEAISNAVEHGNRKDPSKSVCIAVELAPNRVRIEIEDEGTGFRPEEVPDPTHPDRIEYPRGRGLHLIRCYMDHVAFEAGGRRIVMAKDRSDVTCSG
ncbi:MAG: ATP-binding protein [Planctomycetota bacterium]|nr:MAG: ATP-binding protein [Planctomycetota bacterium]